MTEAEYLNALDELFDKYQSAIMRLNQEYLAQWPDDAA